MAWNIGGATLVALLVCDSRLCAVKTAPPIVMLSVAKHLFRFSALLFFQGGQGELLAKRSPYPPLTPKPL
ncbi:MAG: hypothetical protein K2N54_07940, partial [Helicobacter sp.]|nr:hypothetical protein [Helicobacter sp.]